MKKLNQNIVLIGMPGCGKTTIGQMLADRINMKFCDIDRFIEENEQKSVSDIFLNGEGHFRKIEAEAIKKISKISNTVISTGGGVVKSEVNINNLRQNGIIVYINRPIDNIISDIDVGVRPLLKDKKEKIFKLYEERKGLYKKYCTYEVINDTSLEEVVNNIIRLICN